MAYFEIYAAKGLRRKWQLYAEVPRAMSVCLALLEIH